MSSSTDESQGIAPILDPDVDASAAGRSANIKQIRGSSLLLVGRMIGLALDFVAQVLIVRYLEKTEYGAFALALSIVALGTTVCLLGLERTVGRFAPIYQERGDLPRMWGTIVVVISTVVTIGLALVLAMWAFQGLIGGLVENELALSILLIMIVLSPLQALDSLLIALFATFGSARSIFFRRYVFAPVLQLSVVIVLIATHSGVRLLALGYVLAVAAGIAIYFVVLLRLLRRQGLLAHLRRDTLRLPAREIFTFSIPLLASDLVMVLRSSLTIIFLEVLRNTEEVADFRAVLPIAVQNMFVATSFRFIFTPGASRLYAPRRPAGPERPLLADRCVDRDPDLPGLRVERGVRRADRGVVVRRAVPQLGRDPGHPVHRLLRQRSRRVQLPAATRLRQGALHGHGGPHHRGDQRRGDDPADPRVRSSRCGHRHDRLVPAPERPVPMGAAQAHDRRGDRPAGTSRHTRRSPSGLSWQWSSPGSSTRRSSSAIVVVGLISLAVLGLNRHSLRVVETYPELARFPLVRRVFGDPRAP